MIKNKAAIRKEVLRYAGPGILGLVANSVYIVVDGIFVANMLGSDALAAVTTVVPVVEILIALSLMISMGCGIYISMFKGIGDLEKSREYYNHGLLLTVGMAVFISVFSLIFRRPIVSALGATELIKEDALSYFTWFIAFVPFFMLNYALGTWIRNDGKPNLAMAGQLIGAGLNIVLDYVFMGPLKMGIAGAAIATGLGPVVGIIIVLPHFLGKKGDLYIQKFKFRWKRIGEIMVGGLPSFSIEFALGAMTFLCNLFISKRLGEMGLTAFGVVGYVNLIFLSVFLGMGQGTQPLVSRFYGEKKPDSIRYVYRFSLLACAALGVVSYLLLLLLRRPIAAVFISPSDVELTDMTLQAIAMFFFSFWATGINVATASILEAKQSILYSVIISFFRACGFVLLFLALLNLSSDPMLLWLAVPLAELATLAISVFFWRRDSRKMNAALQVG